MLIIDTKLAKQLIIQGKNEGTILAKLKDEKIINLYFRTVENKTYIIAGIDWNNDDNESYYIVANEDIGTIIFLYDEWNKVLNEGIETLTDVVKILKQIKELE